MTKLITPGSEQARELLIAQINHLLEKAKGDQLTGIAVVWLDISNNPNIVIQTAAANQGGVMSLFVGCSMLAKHFQDIIHSVMFPRR